MRPLVCVEPNGRYRSGYWTPPSGSLGRVGTAPRSPPSARESGRLSQVRVAPRRGAGCVSAVAYATLDGVGRYEMGHV